LSGKLPSGDIVSVIAPDYNKQGTTVIPVELKYVEVIGVTASSGADVDAGEDAGDGDQELPSTVTLLVTTEQSKVLASLEADGTIHLALVYRGTAENAAKFIAAQEETLASLYPSKDSGGTRETEANSAVNQSTEAESGAQ
jgi:pilus assembly protein CpaB